MTIQQPNKVYDLILESIENIESELSLISEDQQLADAKRQALDTIKEFRAKEIDPSIEELKQNQEWDTFTIAFYGETNAGKSTVIESLRIYFQEETKIETQNKFKEVLNKYENKLKEVVREISNAAVNPNQFNLQDEINFETIKKTIKTQIENIQNLDTKKKENSIFYKLISFLNLNSVKKDIANLEIKLHQLNEFHEFHESSHHKLSNLADGQIIGDGSPDFTQKSTHYLFSNNGKKFAFLDVPGIEGKESLVVDEITSATKKAHIVFYVTSNPAPPQKGNENKKGTLEKIKEHLSSQTEVYTIFNKRITNPIQLENELVNNDDNESLTVLDEKMKEAIGDNYVKHINLSAYVSFLALSECLISDSKHLKEKNKFLNKFNPVELLEKSCLIDFAEFLTYDLVKNTEQKIKRSNFNKANDVLKRFISILNHTSKDNLEPLYKKLLQEAESTDSNLSNTLKATKNRMKSQLTKATQRFVNEAIKKIYAYIERDIGDKEFERKLELVIKSGQDELISQLPNVLEAEFKKFQDDINEVVSKFQKRATATMEEFSTIRLDGNHDSFKLRIKIDNGINGWGVAGGLAGAGAATYFAVMAVNGWNPVGWTMAAWAAAIGVVTGFVGFVKSVRNFFDNDYKMSQQRSSSDENIERVAKAIEKSILEQMQPSFLEFEKKINKIVDDLKYGVEQIRNTNNYLVDSTEKLTQLSHKIQKEGNK
jgi:predicted ATPase